jgi:O-antigen/teichoic acid export membrane protein
MSDSSNSLTESNLLAKNTIYNLVGQAFPVLAAIFSIPILINTMGADGFGVLTLAWMVTGYFGLLDLGVGRSLTKMLSEKLGRDDFEGVPDLIWTALMLTGLMGLSGGLLLSFSASMLVNDLFEMPLALREQAEKSFYVLAISIPIVIASSALSGILQAYQRFDLVNFVRVPVGSLTFLGPVLVLPFSEKLSYIVASLVMVRLLEGVINFAFCIRVVPNLLKNIRVQRTYLGKMLRFGGWMTVSNIIGPLIIYLDRFLIGSIISVAAVAYYAAPSEIVNRLMVIPGAIVGVLFPALGALIGPDPDKAKNLFFNGVKYTFIAVFPVVLIFITFAQEGLTIWLGDEFSLNGTTVLKWLMIGSLMSSFSYFPFAVLHAAGRPDLTAKVHFIEVLIYIVIAWMLINRYGIEGAAIAWVVRASVDSIILFYLAGRVLKITYPKPQILLNASIVIALLFGSMLLPENLNFKLGYTAIVIGWLLVFSWKKILTFEEKSFVLSYLNKFKVS